MLTPDGATAILEMFAAQPLTIRVSDGESATAVAAAGLVGVQDGVLRLRATFGAGEANFEWRIREVLAGATVVDKDVTDFGRKAPGAEWDIDVELALRPDEEQ